MGGKITPGCELLLLCTLLLNVSPFAKSDWDNWRYQNEEKTTEAGRILES
jgi:hypothetical protein